MAVSQSHFDRLDVQEFNRRLEAMAMRVHELATNVAVMVEREKKISEDMTELKDSIDEMKDTFARGRGAIWFLTVSSGVVATVIGFWDKLPKLWGAP